ncbi:substrate-binding periplasmic protein [Spartinivicinus ruber]|uniref:substrate-binding periplasmic protein n=1 Tax=Spartinivicinus ruber TaxID=2683272 RepID=UPI0013D62302|nr:transporter substrate-binding domain-containing protein [Spartinivicinus ruber]
MKNYYHIFFTIFIALIYIKTPVSSADTMSLAYMEHWFPISQRTKNGMEGILIDIMNEALSNRLGISISHHGYPWIRAQEYVKDGVHDAMITTPTEERSKYGVFGKEPVLFRSYSIYVKKGNPLVESLKKIQTLEDLKPFERVDYLGNGWTKKYMDGKGYKIHNVVKKYQMWRVLNAEQGGDYILENPFAIRTTLKKLGLHDEFIEIPTTLPELNFYYVIIASKKSPFTKILPKFDEQIRAMKKDGSWDAILDKWYSQQD